MSIDRPLIRNLFVFLYDINVSLRGKMPQLLFAAKEKFGLNVGFVVLSEKKKIKYIVRIAYLKIHEI